MAKVIVNLTLAVITETLEEVLEFYPQTEQQAILASVEVQQEILAYVLSRFPSFYAVIEAEAIADMIPPNYSLEQRMQLEALIHQAIRYFSHPHSAQFEPQTLHPPDTELEDTDVKLYQFIQ
jgi:hypothetical protein